MHEFHQSYNLVLVGSSYGVSVLGSFAALQLALGIPLAQTGKQRTLEVLFAGASMGGGGIWAMHFIAMLACDIGAPVRFDLILTLASAVLAIAACSAGLAIVARGGSRLANLSIAGILMGLGVAGMHYLGMAALLTTLDVSYRPELVLLSILIAIVASMVALWLAFNLRGIGQMVGSAMVMGVAVCGMHYTAMAAVVLSAGSNQRAMPVGGLSTDNLGLIISGVVSILLVTVIGLSVVRQRRRAELTI